MQITKVNKESIAGKLGLLSGDKIVSINGQKIRDVIDFNFYYDEDIELEIERDQKTIICEIEGGFDESFGAEFQEFDCKSCGNKCIFCFVDQNPPGVRSSLRFKDEDYRMSFLYGNYVTLTNLSHKDLDRIIEQRLSPLYISVHAFDPQVRKKMLGIKGDDKLFEKISRLAKNRIEMHCQIVLCPGWNDGQVLEETIFQLKKFFPNIKTVAIVPVGLTKHRDFLVKLHPVDKKIALELISWEQKAAREFKKELGKYFIFLADEIYLVADQKIPKSQRYEDYAQIENGVGMVRSFLDEFEKGKNLFPKQIKTKKLAIVTGLLAAPVLQNKVLPFLQQINGLELDLVVVQNNFFGPGVTVSGLLVGQDIARFCKNLNSKVTVVLPPNCLNEDGLFLDDWDIDKLEKTIKREIIKSNGNFLDIIKRLN